MAVYKLWKDLKLLQYIVHVHILRSHTLDCIVQLTTVVRNLIDEFKGALSTQVGLKYHIQA